MSHNDSNFYKPFVLVLGALIIFTAFIMFVANVWSPDSPDDPLAVAAMKKSIQPVGQSRVDEVEMPAEAEAPDESASTTDTEASPEAPEVQDAENAAQTAEAEGSADTTETATETTAETTTENQVVAADTATTAAGTAAAGGAASLKVKAVVATNCAGCHNVGLHGAAKTDDSQAWAALSEKGLDVLTASVIDGKGRMPARAETSLSDEEIGQAVQLMVTNATGSAAMATATATGSTGTAATAAVAETSETATTEPMTEDSSAAVASAEIPAEIKQVVDTTCSACHLVGVANSPKLGDKDAWGKRLDAKGLDGLVASSIAGIGVMPPRGGSSLDDEQMKLAVEYMLSK